MIQKYPATSLEELTMRKLYRYFGQYNNKFYNTGSATNQEMPGKECVEYNYWALCWACVSSYANISALGQWSFIRLVSSQQLGPVTSLGPAIHLSMSGAKHFHCPYLSNTLTPSQLPTKSDRNSQYTYNVWVFLNAMKYSIFFDKREETWGLSDIINICNRTHH